MAASHLRKLLVAIERELRPEPSRVAEAHRRARTLIAELQSIEHAWMFNVLDAVTHGSHARETAIVGFKDIDYLVVLDPDSLRTTNGAPRSARDTVQRLAAFIQKRRGGLVSQGAIEVRAQDHSVGVKYPSSRLRIDLVPALRTGERGCFLIPSRSAEDWIETRPHQLKRRITLAERRNPYVRAAIRLIKGWRRARGKAMQIPSYAVELLLGHWASEDLSLEGLVFRFFQTFAESDARRRLVLLGEEDNSSITIRDPWSGENVADELGAAHRARLVENSRRALDDIEEGETLAVDGRERGALGMLRRVFMGNFEA